MPTLDAAIMPQNTGVPTARRLISEAPVAITNGSRPRMKAKLVIITARNRSLAPRIAASWIDLPCLALLLGEFDDQDAVLRRQRDQHDDADLRVKVEREAGEADRRDRRQDADRDREQDRNRDGPALIQPDQEQEGEQDRQAEDDGALAGGRLLLERGAGPLVAVAARQRVAADALHRGQRVAGAAPGAGSPLMVTLRTLL